MAVHKSQLMYYALASKDQRISLIQYYQLSVPHRLTTGVPGLVVVVVVVVGWLAYLWDGVGQQAVELLVRAVPHAAPARRVEVLPDAAQADGHPLAQQRVRVVQLLQANGNQVALETGLLK